MLQGFIVKKVEAVKSDAPYSKLNLSGSFLVVVYKNSRSREDKNTFILH